MANEFETSFYRSIPPSVLSAIFPGEARWLRPYCVGGKPDKNAVATAMRYLKDVDPLYYNSLLDKHTKGYRTKPTIKSHLQKYGYLAEDGKVYPTRREQLEANKISRTVREREAMVTQLEIRERERLERLKRAARAGKIAFTPDGIIETKPCSVCPSVYHKVPSIMDPEDPCPGSCLNSSASQVSNPRLTRLTANRSSMTTTQPKEDVGVQCRRSSLLCARCATKRSVPCISEPPPVAQPTSGRKDAFPKDDHVSLREASSPKDDTTEAANMQRANYRAMLDEEEEALRRMIEIERQKLNKIQKEADLAEKTALQQREVLKLELEAEKERNILERKRKVALGAVLIECERRAKSQMICSQSVDEEITEMKKRFEDAIRHKRVLYLKPPKSAPLKPPSQVPSTENHTKANATFSSASSGSLEAELTAISAGKSAESLMSASSKGSSKSSKVVAVADVEKAGSPQMTVPSKGDKTTHNSRGTNTSPPPPPPPPPIDPHPRKHTRVLHQALGPLLPHDQGPHPPHDQEPHPPHDQEPHPPHDQEPLLPHVPQSTTVELQPLCSPAHPTVAAKPRRGEKDDSLLTLGSHDQHPLGVSPPPLVPRGQTATKRSRQGKSRESSSPSSSDADRQDENDGSPKLKLPPVVTPHLSEWSQLSVPCNSTANGVVHAARPTTSCPVNAHRKAQHTEPAVVWKSLPAVVAGNKDESELISLMVRDAKGQSQALKPKEADKGPHTDAACTDTEQGGKAQPVVLQGPSGNNDPVGGSSSVPNKLHQRTKEAPRPPRSSLPASMPSRNSKEKVPKLKIRQSRVTPSPVPISSDEDSICGKHVSFKTQGGVSPPPVADKQSPPGGLRDGMGGSASVPNRLHQGSKEVVPRPLRCSLPATLQARNSEEMGETHSPSIGYGSAVAAAVLSEASA